MKMTSCVVKNSIYDMLRMLCLSCCATPSSAAWKCFRSHDEYEWGSSHWLHTFGPAPSLEEAIRCNPSHYTPWRSQITTCIVEPPSRVPPQSVCIHQRGACEASTR